MAVVAFLISYINHTDGEVKRGHKGRQRTKSARDNSQYSHFCPYHDTCLGFQGRTQSCGESLLSSMLSCFCAMDYRAISSSWCAYDGRAATSNDSVLDTYLTTTSDSSY